MNEFEKRMNTLRLQFKAEQRKITKDSFRTIGRLNLDISRVSSPEAREALRDEKERTFEAMRRSHEINRTCYTQQLELLIDEQNRHFEKNPSNSRIRRLIAKLSREVESKGDKTLTFSIGDNRHCKISFE